MTMTTTEHAKPTGTAGESTGTREIVRTAAPDNPMAIIAAGLESGTLQPEQLSKLMDLQERWERNAAASAFGDALAAFQRDCPPIVKERRADRYYFAGLDDIMAKIRPVLGRHGLSVTFDTEHNDGGNLTVVCIVRHGIHEQRSRHTMPVPKELKVNSAQQYGAALSYAKRYALCAALNIVVTDEDNDAATPTEYITPEQAVQIEEMLDAYNVNRPAFFTWIGVPSVAEIPAAKFLVVYGMLQKKGGAK